jgi:cell division septum initiation protein DivIVA
MSCLQFYCRELEQENEKLRRQVAALQEEVAAHRGELDPWERDTMARAATLKESETFRQRTKAWHSDAIERNSKAVQVGGGVACGSEKNGRHAAQLYASSTPAFHHTQAEAESRL